jgi:hypothetical protein
MTKEKRVSEWYQLIGLTFPTFPPNFYLFFKRTQPFRQQKTIQSDYIESCLASQSVADPGCLSRIPDPDFYPSQIPDLGSKISSKREG